MPHFQKKMDLKLSVGVRYDAICMERLSQNRRTDRIIFINEGYSNDEKYKLNITEVQ